MKRRKVTTPALLLSFALAGCGDSSPAAPENRTLPTGFHSMVLRGCFACPFNTTPGNLLLFQGEGVRIGITVLASDAASTQVRYEAAEFGQNNIDVSDRFEFRTLTLDWTEVAIGGPAYLGRMLWGGSGLMTHTLRVRDGRIECGFAMLTANLDFGGGTCTVG